MTTATQTDTDPTRRRADVHAAIRALRPGLADISDHDELHGLGLDSLDRIALAVSLERLTGRPIPDRDLADARTVADLLHCASADQEPVTAAPNTAPAHTAPTETAFGWVDPGGRVGVNTRLWHQAQIAPGARVGDDCALGKGVFVGAGSVVGDRVKIGNGANLFGAIVADDVMICPGALLLEDPTPRATTPEGRPKGPADFQRRPVVVERGATIVPRLRPRVPPGRGPSGRDTPPPTSAHLRLNILLAPWLLRPSSSTTSAGRAHSVVSLIHSCP